VPLNKEADRTLSHSIPQHVLVST